MHRRPRQRVWRPVVLRDDNSVSAATEQSPTIHAQEDGPRGPNDERGTCYAYATATAIRSAQMRIFSRAVECHKSLVREITQQFGCDGADMDNVLSWLCPLKNLHYQVISQDEAQELLRGVTSRVVLGTFDLSESEWMRFSRYFRAEPTEVLQAAHLHGPAIGTVEGHAVVITGESNDAWFIKNSWGEDFADDGYFRVAKDAIQFRFYDVCFLPVDLSHSEISAYRLAPPVLEVTLVHPHRSDRNPISSLGWEIDFQTFRIERVRKRNCSIASWNRSNPFKRIQPGYQIVSVNEHAENNDMIAELQSADTLNIRLIISTVAKLDDLLDDRARQFSYAHTIATAIRLTQARIFSRTVEQHDEIVEALVTKWGISDIDVNTILDDACATRGLHHSVLTAEDAVSELSRRDGRNLLATISLDASAWRRLGAFFTSTPHAVLRACDVGNNWLLPQQVATVLVCGVGRSSSGRPYWRIRAPLAAEYESSRMLNIAHDAVGFDFYDMYFYIDDLFPQEIRLFNEAPDRVRVRVKKERRWVRGTLGITINPETLQVEWIATWSPIETQYNHFVDDLERIYPGHFVYEVNGVNHTRAVLDRLDTDWDLTILFVRAL